MRFVIPLAVAALATSGCLSSKTSRTRDAAEREISEAGRAPSRVSVRDDDDPVAGESSRGPAESEPARPPSARALPRSCEEIGYFVVDRLPRVDAARSRAKAALARSRASGTLPAPQATFEIWDFPIGDPSLANREGMYMLGLGQEVPAAGARDGRALAEAEEARAGLAELTQAARGAWGEVVLACAEWSGSEAVRARLDSHRELIAEMREAMLASYRAGGETLASVARMDAELAVADRHIVEAEEERVVARSNLRALVGDELELPERAPPLRTTYPLPDPEHLTEVALSSRGDVRAVLARQRGARARAEATHSEATSPAFEFRATYMQTPSARAGLGAMVGMSLPWLWGDGPDLNESAKHELDAVESDLEEVGRTIRIEVARAAGRVRAQSRSLDMLLERELPAADAALEAERAALRNGGFSLVSWIQSAHALREAHVDEARTRAALQRAWVELELTVGRPLDDAAGEKGDSR